MRKITREIIHAFERGRALKIGNSRTNANALYLFDNKIAEWRGAELWITNAGWQSMTTKERLNGLRGVSIQNKRGQWYLNGVAWDGEWVNVDEFTGSTNGAVEQLPNEVEFDVTSRLTGNFDTPIYSVFHTHNESSLEGVEEVLNREGIPNRRMESDTSGEWKPNYFVVVRPDDVSKAVSILSELYCIA